MSNASTVRRQVGGSQQLTIAPLVGSTITTTKTAFSLNNNALTLTGGGVIPLAVGVTGLYAGTGQVLQIHAAGTIVGATGASTTLILEMYEVPASVIAAGLTPTSFTNMNAIGTSSTRTIAEATSNFTFDADVQLSSGGVLTGSFKDNIDSQIDSTADIVAITGLAGEQDLNFILVATLAGTTTGVILTLDEFEISLQ